MKSKLLSVAAFLLLALGLNAQPQMPQDGSRPARPEMKDPAVRAQEEVDLMKKELGIDDKQYKKVYKLLKKDYTYRQDVAKSGSSSGFPGGMDFPGGGMGGPGGGMPMGGPGMGGPGGGMGGPGGGMGMGDMPERKTIDDEYIEKQETKLKKILTESQYKQWRAGHPVELPEDRPTSLPAEQ